MQLDFNELLDRQGPIDVIIHKLTDHINRFLGQGQEALKWMEMVQVCILHFTFLPTVYGQFEIHYSGAVQCIFLYLMPVIIITMYICSLF